MQDFHDLHVWARAHAQALRIRRCIRRYFPRRGFNDVANQLTRAAESVGETIAEGCGAATRKEFARFLDMSIKSSCEVEYELLLAHDHDILPTIPWTHLTRETIEIRKMTCALRRRIRDADAEEERRLKSQQVERHTRPRHRD